MLAWVEAAFRWTHVVAGILWIGHLYFFNFVNAQVVKTYDAESKKKVVPELMPRALYWFRWGALYTWISGILLAGLVYYSVDNLVDKDVTGTAVIPHLAGVAIALALIAIVFFVYDAAWRVVSKNERVAVGIQSGLFVVAAVPALEDLHGPRPLHPRRHALRDDHGDERLDADLAGAEEDHPGREGRRSCARPLGACHGGPALEAQHVHVRAARLHDGREPLSDHLRPGR